LDPPIPGEIREVITRLNNNKAPGEEGIPAEIFKAGIDELIPHLHQLICKIWINEELTQDWNVAVLLPFFKKGDKRVCSNYRGISLTDVAAKIFTIILLRRFQLEKDRRTRPNQCGFRPGCGCTDKLFTLRRTMEQRW